MLQTSNSPFFRAALGPVVSLFYNKRVLFSMKLAFKCLCPCRWTLNRTLQFALNGAIQNLLKDEKYCNHYKGLFIPVILSMKSVALKSMYMIRVG